MRVELFDYRLPPRLIAQAPVEPRSGSRLLAVNCSTGERSHRLFRDLPLYLSAGDCVVFNRSRVRKARLKGVKEESGGRVELLLLEEKGDGCWSALARPARRLRPGTRLLLAGGRIRGEIRERGKRGEVMVFLRTEDGCAMDEALERWGEMPLPPYIRRPCPDPDRYQTVYASETGSVAAPTAGLHFDEEMIGDLRGKGVATAFLRLDVGLDTFRPIEGEEVEGHRMHREWVEVDDEVCAEIGKARERGGRVVAVGTTTARALETASAGGETEPFRGYTDLFIYPGYRFRAVDALLTNFHLPRSTLLVMICAFAGRELVMEVYREAVEKEYRFLSFGDACFFYYPGRWKPPSG